MISSSFVGYSTTVTQRRADHARNLDKHRESRRRTAGGGPPPHSRGWLEEARRFLDPTLNSRAESWTRSAAVRYLHEEFLGRFRGELPSWTSFTPSWHRTCPSGSGVRAPGSPGYVSRSTGSATPVAPRPKWPRSSRPPGAACPLVRGDPGRCRRRSPTGRADRGGSRVPCASRANPPLTSASRHWLVI